MPEVAGRVEPGLDIRKEEMVGIDRFLNANIVEWRANQASVRNSAGGSDNFE